VRLALNTEVQLSAGWEPLNLVSIFPNATAVAKRERSSIPVVGWFVRRVAVILLDREARPSAARKLLAECRKAIQAGRIFPEGTRRGVAESIEFKSGLGLLYARFGVAVQPVLLNSGPFWSHGQSEKLAGAVTISDLPPIGPGLSNGEFRARARLVLERERVRLVADCPASKRKAGQGA